MNSHHANPLHSATSHALQLRLPLFPHRAALRLSHHEIIPNLTIDTYAGHVLFTAYSPYFQFANHIPTKLQQLAHLILDFLTDHNLPAHGVILKYRQDNLSQAASETRDSYQLLAGSAPPDQFSITENNRRYIISFTSAGFATGLFLDMANGRDTVQGLAAQYPQVLNLFSYTGAFSIAAARGGAANIIEVDTSQKWLNWSKNNQQLNNIHTIRQRRDDAVKFLTRQKDSSFDLIICDPPSYARPRRSKPFTIKNGYRDMAKHFSRVLRPSGLLLACCNHTNISPEQFCNWLPSTMTFQRWTTPPHDFTQAAYLKIALLQAN